MQHQRMIKFFLEADSKEELVAAMIANNVRFGAACSYDPPMKDGKKWIVWFIASIVDLQKFGLLNIQPPKATERE